MYKLLSCAVAPLLLIGCVTANAERGDVPIPKPKPVVNNDYDGTYSLNAKCSWSGYGSGSIGDGKQWVIKDGFLNHKAYRFDVKGRVVGTNMQVSGTRQSKSDLGWHSLRMNVVFPSGKLSGTWKNGDCTGFLELKKLTPVTGNSKTYYIAGSKDYDLITNAIADRPVNNNHKQPKLKLLLQYPEVEKDTYPLVAILPSSQGMEWYDEVATAKDFRKFGYATLLIYSYEARGVGGNSAETGKSINTPTMARDALLALQAMQANPKLDMSKTALYGASKGSLAVEETMMDEFVGTLPTYKVLLSENSNMCLDFSKVPLRNDIRLVVFTGGKDDSGTLSECFDRTKIYLQKGYNIKHINYPDSAHRFIITEPRGHGYLPQRVDGYGYSKCEWLVNDKGNIGYRIKSSNVTIFPTSRASNSRTIGGCLNNGIMYGGTEPERKQFFNDAHAEMQKVFEN